jgi:hypothetical protein
VLEPSDIRRAFRGSRDITAKIEAAPTRCPRQRTSAPSDGVSRKRARITRSRHAFLFETLPVRRSDQSTHTII